ncbi:MAG TPA: LCP family protein [Candidatus Saccharimonadales bacterium]|nr:LCP family protein [Candidatus Saccharimonadales bacterium]
MNRHARKKDFDVHRTLAQGAPRAHSLRAKNVPLDDTAETKPAASGGHGFWFYLKRLVIGLVLLIFVGAITIGVWDAIELSQASKKMFGSGNLFSLFLGTNLASQNGRTNILLAGYSADDPGHAGANLTDSIMLISLDKNTKTGYLLSIPRDLYVQIPGGSYSKINALYEQGQANGFSAPGYPSGGMGLLEQTVSNSLGVPINYYALIDYAAFRDTVNAVGGVDVTINSPDGRLYDPNRDWTTGGPLVDLSNGTHHLNGQQALDLARARGDPSPYGYAVGFEQSDYQRTADQRMLLVAVRAKAVSWKSVINPTRAGHLFDGMANNVKTDINTSNVMPLYGLIDKIKISQLKSYSLNKIDDKTLLNPYTSYYSGDSLIPAAGIDDFSAIQAAISQLNQ